MTYKVTLKKAHINWGEYRHTDTREKISEEGYIPIPSDVAKEYNILNSNSGATKEYQIFSTDGFLKGEIVIPSGSKEKGNPFAKQFQGKGNLKLIGKWYNYVNASIGDEIVVQINGDRIDVELKKG